MPERKKRPETELAKATKRMLATLTPRERKVLNMRFRIDGKNVRGLLGPRVETLVVDDFETLGRLYGSNPPTKRKGFLR